MTQEQELLSIDKTKTRNNLNTKPLPDSIMQLSGNIKESAKT